MKYKWIIDSGDIQKVKDFYKAERSGKFVRERKRRNCGSKKSPISRDLFWFWLVGCLLTTQQRSGPNSAVSRFLDSKPFPLSYRRCKKAKNLAPFARKLLTSFGGIRRSSTLASELMKNFKLLEDGLWPEVMDKIHDLQSKHTKRQEVAVADFIDDNFIGFGPKQSRNLLQVLGLTQHEIPIDSRITKWLNAFGFPVKLTATGLGDREYYRFVMSGFQAMCKSAGILPCLMDAAIFASFDKGELE